MTRLDDFTTMLAGWPDKTHLKDMTPSGYLTAAGATGPWVFLDGKPQFIHIESINGATGSNVVVAVDQTNDPANASAVYDTIYTTSRLGSGSPAGDGYTVNSRGFARVRIVSTSGTTASIGATISR
jgi:hypothetical protein